MKNLPKILIKDTYVELPIKKDGIFDKNGQDEVVRKHNIIREKKNILLENPGKYPVYSTQGEEIFGFIDDYMYDGNYLIWNTDGLAGYIKK